MKNKKDIFIPQFEQKTTCGCIPACLQQVFEYYNKQISQEEIVKSIKNPERGMSIPAAGLFGKKHGFKTLIITNNNIIFNPTLLSSDKKELIKNLKRKKRNLNKYNQSLVDDYLGYIKIAGKIKFEKNINKDLFKKYLSKNIPIIIELSSTHLYKKEKIINSKEIEGHGIVIAGFNKNQIKIVDPDLKNNPYSKSGIYWVPIKDLITAFSSLEGKSLLLISRKSI